MIAVMHNNWVTEKEAPKKVKEIKAKIGTLIVKSGEIIELSAIVRAFIIRYCAKRYGETIMTKYIKVVVLRYFKYPKYKNNGSTIKNINIWTAISCLIPAK